MFRWLDNKITKWVGNGKVIKINFIVGCLEISIKPKKVS